MSYFDTESISWRVLSNFNVNFRNLLNDCEQPRYLQRILERSMLLKHSQIRSVSIRVFATNFCIIMGCLYNFVWYPFVAQEHASAMKEMRCCSRGNIIIIAFSFVMTGNLRSVLGSCHSDLRPAACAIAAKTLLIVVEWNLVWMQTKVWISRKT